MNLYIIFMQGVKYPGLINYYLAKPVGRANGFWSLAKQQNSYGLCMPNKLHRQAVWPGQLAVLSGSWFLHC
jgi:hypothetical protein